MGLRNPRRERVATRNCPEYLWQLSLQPCSLASLFTWRFLSGGRPRSDIPVTVVLSAQSSVNICTWTQLLGSIEEEIQLVSSNWDQHFHYLCLSHQKMVTEPLFISSHYRQEFVMRGLALQIENNYVSIWKYDQQTQLNSFILRCRVLAFLTLRLLTLSEV